MTYRSVQNKNHISCIRKETLLNFKKEFVIDEVRETRITNAPFIIFLAGEPFEGNIKPSLVLDAKTCSRHNLPMSLGLAGRKIICSLKSYRTPLLKGGFLNRGMDWEKVSKVQEDILKIISLEEKEMISFFVESIPPKKRAKKVWTLKLASFGVGSGIHVLFSPLSCPRYEIAVELNESEYKVCKALSSNTVFKVSFSIAD